MSEGANYCGWEEAYEYNRVPMPFEVPEEQKIPSVKQTIIYRVLKGDLEKALRNMSLEDFRKMKSSEELGASPRIVKAVKDIFSINIKSYTNQPILVITSEEAKNQTVLDYF